MNDYILKFKPIFYPKIWGGQNLKTYFEKDDSEDTIGEAWIISAHENGDTIVDGGPYGGRKLSELYVNEPLLFGKSENKEFPLLVKFIDAQDDLSVQVHPDDIYAKTIGEQYGKEEAWFVIDSKRNQMVQLGHTAKTKEEFSTLIVQKRWSELLEYRPINKYDLIPVKPGTLHAILGGTFVLEIQQSSDRTYRIYDYDRVDHEGNVRALHIEESIAVTNVPDKKTDIINYKPQANKIEKLWSGNYFTLKFIRTTSITKIKKGQNEFVLLALVSGYGCINNVAVKQGDGVIATQPISEIILSPGLEVMLVYPK